MEEQKRKAIYNREADKKYRDNNKDRVRYTNYKSNARVFIRDLMLLEDVEEFEKLLQERKEQLEKIKI